MTVRNLVLPICLVSFLTVACEEKKASDAEATPGTAASAEAAKPAPVAAPVAAVPPTMPVKEPALPGPQEVCQGLIEAARAKDDSKILATSTPATATAFGADGVRDHVIETLAAASCGEAKITGDSATLSLGGTAPAQEASFSKAVDGWKFDGAAFVAKYPVKMAKDKLDKGKKAAAKAGHKAAAHGKKHH